MTFSQAEGLTIVEEMRRDPTIFHYSLGGEYSYPIGGVPSQDVVKEFGWERSDFCGICETQMAGAGIGAALMGMRPIVNLNMADWALDAGWQVFVNATKMRFKLANKIDCPVVYRFSSGGNTVHHSSRCHNWFANSPNMFVCVPSMAADARGLWRTVLRTTKDPVAMIRCTGVDNIKGPVPDNDYMIPFGKGDVKREGKDVTIAAVGYMVHLALSAAEDLAKAGINAEVWDPRTLTPFDREGLIASVKKTGAMVVVDDAPWSFGTTGEFGMSVGEAMTPVPPMARVATMDCPIPPPGAPLYNYIIPSTEKIIKAVKSVLGRKR
jgi:pyruvate/2-oxoglutarate/acetoin dehydrogenase E1 component